jgi:hypothetical protein
MLETKLINEIIIKKGKITSIDFNINDESYTATIASSKIDISRLGFGPERVCVYNRATKKIKWYFHHCCGMRGFDPYLGDRCPACESKTELTDDASLSFLSYESMEPDFSKLITKLDTYSKNLEKAVKEK